MDVTKPFARYVAIAGLAAVAHQYQLPGGAGAMGTNSENQPGFGVQELQRVPAGQ